MHASTGPLLRLAAETCTNAQACIGRHIVICPMQPPIMRMCRRECERLFELLLAGQQAWQRELDEGMVVCMRPDAPQKQQQFEPQQLPKQAAAAVPASTTALAQAQAQSAAATTPALQAVSQGACTPFTLSRVPMAATTVVLSYIERLRRDSYGMRGRGAAVRCAAGAAGRSPGSGMLQLQGTDLQSAICQALLSLGFFHLDRVRRT